jgi:hypothetical protein
MISQMTETKTRSLTRFVGGRHIADASGRFSYVFNPSSGEVQAPVPLAQCFGGAKNHVIAVPDADLDEVADALIGAGHGSEESASFVIPTMH